MIAGLTFLLLLITPGSSQSQDKKFQHEMSERCAKRGDNIWRNEYEGKKSVYTMQNHLTHYNASLNKCFFLEISQSADKAGITKMYRLFDANKNAEYAIYASPGIICDVMEKHCTTESEWRAMVAPYLEDAKF
jgi:hypothetical protein